MEQGEGSGTLKRQRAPLSDSEDNVLSASEVNDSQKRRRLERAGQENRSPEPSSSGRSAELEMRPDTPAIASVRSRVQQLTQRREGGAVLAQRCLSDPGNPSVIIQDKGFREHLLGEGEFNQRMERFKVPVFQAGPAPSTSSPRTLSDIVTGIQQKLQGSVTPSVKQASRIRQEREQELHLLCSQPIAENAWLKRSNSDPSLAEVDGDAGRSDGSFIEAPATELESSNLGQLQMEWEEPGTPKGEGQREDKEQEELGSHQPKAQSVVESLADEDQSVLKLPIGEEQRLLELALEESGGKETEKRESTLFSVEEDEEEVGEFSYSEEAIEPSTDEELRIWRYPQDKAYKEGEPTIAEEQDAARCNEEEQGEGESIAVEKAESGSNIAAHGEQSEVQNKECAAGNVHAEVAGSPKTEELKKDMKSRSNEEHIESQTVCLLDYGAMGQSLQPTFNRDQGDVEPHKVDTEHTGDTDLHTVNQDQKDIGHTTEKDQQSKEAQAESVPVALHRNVVDVAQVMAESQTNPAETDVAQTLTELRASEDVPEAVDGGQGNIDGLTHENQTEEARQSEGRGSLKKVTFILEPELINDSTLSERNSSSESRGEASFSEAELSSHDETNTAEMIDQMFGEVLEYAGRIEEDRRDDEDRDSGIGPCSGDKDKMDTESEKEKSEEEEAKEEDGCGESKELETSADELLTFPPSGILSPLSKSVEAVVTPLRMAVSQQSNPPSLLLTPEGEETTTTAPPESAPLYSIDTYRTQRQSKLPPIQSVTPGVQRRAPEKSRPQPSINTKDKIAALNEEAGKLQTVINQTLQALSCCTDEEHGRGSLEETEAEKLLLVSCEKRSALLAEVARLREERSSESEKAAEGDGDYISQQPCRGTISICNVQLPLKVEFVCSSRNRIGRPSHYFFVLIRYGPCNIVATPLATATDAQNGDTISFPTSVTLKDIRSNFEIDVEVYSLSHTSGSSCSVDRTSTKSRVTPRKLLNTITRSNNSMTSAALPALNTRRSSNFCLVGSHKITLASLGQSKFPLDKMKLGGKIRRLLGDEFQEKVPFLSPLEGNIYLQLESESHSHVQHQGFLTMFGMINGFGVWHRRYFVLEGYHMNYWNHPNDREAKAAEGTVSLSGSPSQCVKPVKRDSCARPFTFELVSGIQTPRQEDSQDGVAKCWFSADTKQERLDWMEKLNQVLLDFHTWNRPPPTQTETQHAWASSSSSSMKESIL
ncbi:anillin, actin binding protein 2 [Diretmus argenteus]